MYIYNVTINIEEDSHDEWLNWMKEEHIPAMLATGKFTQAKMSKVLVNEDMGGITYSIQYTTNSYETLEKYYQEDAERLRNDGLQKFKDKFVAFRTELQVISNQYNTSTKN
ncbi:MAG: DUF4286 family protein [Lutibacter sp.]